MLLDAGKGGLEHLDRGGVDHIAVAGLLAPLLSDQSLAAGLVAVTIGVQKPEAVDLAAVKAVLPHGDVTVNVRHGGLDVPDPDNDDICVIASAAIDVSYDFDNA